jgi:hypothetical protein
MLRKEFLASRSSKRVAIKRKKVHIEKWLDFKHREINALDVVVELALSRV